MATKRLTRTAIDWNKYAKLVLEKDRSKFDTFKSLFFETTNKVASLPEKLPEIDWNYYKEKTAGFYDVTEFEKQWIKFDNVNVPTSLIILKERRRRQKFKALHIVPMKEPRRFR
ncbi:conserved hypothetical protein [Trichinella spiralis]|uniref:hypothetical protein n=1 Tax=Trichinella spiralis TaxID=6334 RepID=UPI0001EFDE67|nr:conserved hypothetical protein [Trichinella spiralis]